MINEINFLNDLNNCTEEGGQKINTIQTRRISNKRLFRKPRIQIVCTSTYS